MLCPGAYQLYKFLTIATTSSCNSGVSRSGNIVLCFTTPPYFGELFSLLDPKWTMSRDGGSRVMIHRSRNTRRVWPMCCGSARFTQVSLPRFLFKNPPFAPCHRQKGQDCLMLDYSNNIEYYRKDDKKFQISFLLVPHLISLVGAVLTLPFSPDVHDHRPRGRWSLSSLEKRN